MGDWEDIRTEKRWKQRSEICKKVQKADHPKKYGKLKTSIIVETKKENLSSSKKF